MSRLIGRPPISPVPFLTGKISGYIAWVALFLHLTGAEARHFQLPALFSWLGYASLAIGLLLTAVSLFDLGNSISFGVPAEETTLKTHGLYKYSRNPMYAGFFLLTLAAILITSNFYVLALGVYSIIIYHLIILGEEAFLKNRFGSDYEAYCKRTRRYF